MKGASSSTQCTPTMAGGRPRKGVRSITHSKNGSRVTFNPASGSCAGTIRSMAVLANAAVASRASATASGSAARTRDSSASVALMAFSQAKTASRCSPSITSSPDSIRCSMPRAITGATNGSTRGPTAVVTTSAVAISSMSRGSSVRLLIARKFVTVEVPPPISVTV